MKKRGSITVFFSLFMAVFLVLIQTMFRSVQTAGGRVQAEAGVEEGLYSVFAGFDRELFEKYHVFFLDGGYGTGTLQPGRMYQVIEGCLDRSLNPGGKFTGIRGENLWKCSEGGGAITGYTLATDLQGQMFQKQAVDYMKETVGIQGIQLLLQKERMQERIVKEQEKTEGKDIVNSAKKEYETAMNQSTEKGSAEMEMAEVSPDFVNPLEVIRDLQKRGVLSLVLPKETPISQQKLGEASSLSRRPQEGGMGILYSGEGGNGTVDQLLFREYMAQHLECFTETELQTGRMAYQLEYVIGGKDTDEENLKTVVKRLLAIRQASNMAYLLSDISSQTQIHQLAVLIGVSMGIPVLESVISLVLQAAWAFGESVLDVRQLLQGGKVPLIKTKPSWQLSLEQLKDLPGLLNQEPKKEGTGLSYKEYLRILLSLGRGEMQIYRTMDMVERTMRTMPGKENFRMDLCVGYLEVEWKVFCGRNDFSIRREYGYDM